MLMLITDNPEGNEYLEEILPIDGLLIVSCFEEAEKHLLYELPDSIIIDKMLIEKDIVKINDLKRIKRLFDGIILIKVANELAGIKLMKNGLISEYYISDEDKNKEKQRLKKAFKLATIRHDLNSDVIKCKNNLKTINSINNS